MNKIRLLTTLFFILMIESLVVAQNLSEINVKIDSLVDNSSFNGRVLITKSDSTLVDRNYGVANRSYGVKIDKSSLFKVASFTKVFTSVIILQLAEENKIDVHETFGRYLPDYTGEAGSKVTIHQLLNHTSGMRLIDTVSSIESAMKNGIGFYQLPNTIDEIIKNECSDKLVDTPGEKFVYNNSDYIILGKIIENVSGGKSFEDVLQERILAPLELSNTGMAVENRVVLNMTDAYFKFGETDSLINNLPIYIENWYAAGAMYSSPYDIAKFVNKLFNGELLNTKSIQMLTNPGLDNYGYGLWIYSSLNGTVVERYGNIMGLNHVWRYYIEEDVLIVLLNNTNIVNIGDLASELKVLME